MADLLSQEAKGYETDVVYVRQAAAVMGGIMVCWHVEHIGVDETDLKEKCVRST